MQSSAVDEPLLLLIIPPCPLSRFYLRRTPHQLASCHNVSLPVAVTIPRSRRMTPYLQLVEAFCDQTLPTRSSMHMVGNKKIVTHQIRGWPTNAFRSDEEATTALSTMIVYNMLNHTFSTQSRPDQIGRAEGVMLYIPADDAGLLMYFGAIQVMNWI